MIYFDTINAWFVHKEDLARLRDVPGGEVKLDGRSHNVHFTVSDQTTEAILKAARQVKR